ncbi:hypothetical protein [Pseudomonas sp. S1_E04]
MDNRPAPQDQVAASRALLQRTFADRPRLEDVANTLIDHAWAERFNGQALRAASLTLGVPPHTQSLADALISRVMRGEAVNYTPGYHQVLRSGRPVPRPVTTHPTVDDLEQLINLLGPLLVGTFQQRLADYWSATPSLIDPLSTRWRIVSEQLRRCLQNAPQNPPLSPEQRQRVLGQLYADRESRDRHIGEQKLQALLV